MIANDVPDPLQHWQTPNTWVEAILMNCSASSMSASVGYLFRGRPHAQRRRARCTVEGLTLNTEATARSVPSLAYRRITSSRSHSARRPGGRLRPARRAHMRIVPRSLPVSAAISSIRAPAAYMRIAWSTRYCGVRIGACFLIVAQPIRYRVRTRSIERRQIHHLCSVSIIRHVCFTHTVSISHRSTARQ